MGKKSKDKQNSCKNSKGIQPQKPERKAVGTFPGVYVRESKKKLSNETYDQIFWITWFENGQRRWFKVGEASKGITDKIAYDKLVETVNCIRLGENPTVFDRKKASTFNEIMEAYFLRCESDGKNTNVERSRYLKHVFPVFGNLTIHGITPSMLDKFKRDLLNKLAPASVKRTFTTMRAAINLAIKRSSYKGANPLSLNADFSMPKENNAGERFLTPQEAKSLLTELEKHSVQLFHMATLSLLTGMRATEIFSLKGADIDKVNCIAVIRAKGGERQPVMLTKEALDILLIYYTTPSALLFHSSTGVRIKKISDTFKRVVDKLGLNNGISDKRHRVWFHTLRHTYASWLAQSGQLGIYEIMKLMRHKRIEMTLRYAHLIPSQQREKLSIITKNIFDCPPKDSGKKTRAIDQEH